MSAFWSSPLLKLGLQLSSVTMAVLWWFPAVASPSLSNLELVKDNLFPVELQIGGQKVLSQLLIKQKARNWFVPFNQVAQALELEVIPGENQQVELRSPLQSISLAPGILTRDPKLGLVVSLDALQSILAVNSQLDTQTNKLNLSPPWLAYRQYIEQYPALTMRATGSDSPLEVQGNPRDLSISYRDLNNNWYIRTKAADPLAIGSLQLQEGQYHYQSDNADYVLGIQPQMWLSQGTGQFLGFTSIQRWGFSPPTNSGGVFNHQRRLQAAQVPRTIAGKDTPGTRLELVKPDTQEVIASLIVGDDGYYQFDQVPTNPGIVTRYQIKSYAPDQSSPRVKNISFHTLAYQLPARASALTVSGGIKRQFIPNSGLLGDLTDFQGGINYRVAVANDLTLGVGLVYNELFKGIGEIFYQPSYFPLQLSLSTVSSADGEGWEIHSQMQLNLLDNLGAYFNSDRFGQQFGFNWQAFPGFNLGIKGTHRLDFLSPGFTVSYQSPQFSTFIQGELKPDEKFLWSFSSRLQGLQLIYQQQPHLTLSDLSYNVTLGYWIFVSYQIHHTRFLDQDLTIVGCRYHSAEPILDLGQWQLSLGYAFNRDSSGIIASFLQELTPGLGLQLDYTNLSLLNQGSSFALKLVPRNPFSP